MTYKTKAIILRSQELKEYDRIYTIFSREKGKMRVLGIGTRKPTAKLASGLEPITESELFCIRGRKWDRVAGVIIDEQFPSIKNDLDAIIQAKRLFAILEDLLTEEEASENVFDALDLYLRTLEKNLVVKIGTKNQIALLVVIWKAVFAAGYNPELFRCISCNSRIQRQESCNFKIPEGLVCKNCGKEFKSGRIEILENTLKALRFVTEKKPEISLKLSVPENTAKQLQYLTRTFLQHILGKEAVL